MMHQSIATIDSPEFINLQPLEINPLMSSCEIKVLYLGENRNHSYITKEVATEMAKTLRGAPIVGYYKEDKEDFRDHGEKIIFDDEGIKFECLTKPYGFVAPDARVWFQKFEDTDDFGNKVTREYLMTTGYLWTGQFEEAKLALEGRPQSMELDEETLDGHWSTNNKTGMDFFIINDAIFSKLCILGEDVEPCFEGSSITAPEVSKTFTKMDDDFKKTLFTMMKDLQVALKGGYKMELEDKTVETEEVTETPEVETTEPEAVETPAEETAEAETTEENAETAEESDDSIDAAEPSQEEYTAAKKDDEDESKEDEDDSADDNDKDSEDNDDEKKKDYALLENELEALKTSYAEMEAKYQELVTFKETVDNEKKDALINSFYMLSDEDKKDVIENKSKYSLDEIEAKLSVICVRKKVNFDLEETSENKKDIEEEEIVTYNLNNDESTTPAWLKALKRVRDSRE